jgi:predicted glutamine amidotransferase
MCGIAGIFETDRAFDYNRVELARQLLLSIETRGKHATGYAYIQDHATVLEKADVKASDFVQAANYFTDQSPYVPRTLLLHARYATQGSPTINENNHPIYSKRSGLTMIHNGWLTNEAQLLKRFRLKKDAEVDSETVLRLIEHFMLNKKKRIITAIKLAMRQLKGVFACALISERHPNTLWLWRSGYPLVYTQAPNGAFIFASTEALLEDALKKARIKVAKIVNFPSDQAGIISISKGEAYVELVRLNKHRAPKKKKEKATVSMPASRTFNCNSSFCGKDCDGNITDKSKCLCVCHGLTKPKPAPATPSPLRDQIVEARLAIDQIKKANAAKAASKHNDEFCHDACDGPTDCYCKCHDTRQQMLLRYADDVLRWKRKGLC